MTDHPIDAQRAMLRTLVLDWSCRLSVNPRVVRIQRMKHKWGSCSSSGIVTISLELALREREFQDFVIAHELLHLAIPNHGKLFKARLSAAIPKWRSMDQMR